MEEINKKSLYTESQKSAIYRYVDKNRNTINEYHRDYYHNHLKENDDYKEKKKLQAKEYYNKKKDSEEFKEKARQSARDYYLRNKEKLRKKYLERKEKKSIE
jgi:hypothetical protein